MSPRQPVLDVAALTAFLAEVFPQVRGEAVIEAVGPCTARLRLAVADRHLRPGGTVSGPTMFMLADLAFYVAVLAMIGREPLTVTTNLSINFLRKPPLADLIGEARILKLGRSLAVGDVTLTSVEDPRPVAHASCTYAIPPGPRTG
ncbi:PaaI family thioesterase [Paralimibaculum aggregatum]|uniref:PaaI family thioesterase n=1 Tax=Paralimibaculum aggregatum TaxID=3036245 RepID=A0ABQ6LNF2_9RHOB|nr:PaaI family thioesterase [Limibaculum sp. NKW23]GMG84735.1 PaaI family thioesterase [Limibaculum sp. NKW23]